MSFLQIRLEPAGSYVRQRCFICRLSECPQTIDTFAVADLEPVRWLCFKCRKLDPASIKEELLTTARDCRAHAEWLESLAKGKITLPTKEEFAAAVRMAEEWGAEPSYDLKTEFLEEFGHLDAGYNDDVVSA